MHIDKIDSVVCEILVQVGPDGHVDGHDTITEFIAALLRGDDEAEQWVTEFLSDHKENLVFMDEIPNTK